MPAKSEGPKPWELRFIGTDEERKKRRFQAILQWIAQPKPPFLTKFPGQYAYVPFYDQKKGRQRKGKQPGRGHPIDPKTDQAANEALVIEKLLREHEAPDDVVNDADLYAMERCHLSQDQRETVRDRMRRLKKQKQNENKAKVN